jgi:hypothetical protein
MSDFESKQSVIHSIDTHPNSSVSRRTIVGFIGACVLVGSTVFLDDLTNETPPRADIRYSNTLDSNK